jgi:hypothetical protein
LRKKDRTMRCEEIQPSLMDYSRQPQSCPDCESIRAHLDGCEDCRKLLEQEKKLVASLSALGPVGPSSDMWPVVRDHIRVKSPAWGFASWMSWSVGRKLAAAGAAALVITGMSFVGVTQHVAQDRQTAAVVHLVDMQQQNVAASWTDDPLKDGSDRVTAALEEGS